MHDAASGAKIQHLFGKTYGDANLFLIRSELDMKTISNDSEKEIEFGSPAYLRGISYTKIMIFPF